jgi:hypothetical protein
MQILQPLCSKVSTRYDTASNLPETVTRLGALSYNVNITQLVTILQFIKLDIQVGNLVYEIIPVKAM